MRKGALWFGALLWGALSCSHSSDDPAPLADAAPGGETDVAGDSGSEPETGACTVGDDPAPTRAACGFAAGATPSATLGACATGERIPVGHIVLLMQENRSFDHYLGHLKGHGQDDVDVAPDDASNPPFVAGASDAGGAADGAAPEGGSFADGEAPEGGSPGPVLWHHLDDYCFDDTNHEWVPSHLEWNQGKNDGFVVQNAGANDALGFDRGGGRSMGYYDQNDLPFYYGLAKTFAISDRYFCDVMGPTFPNRRYFYAGTSFGYTENDLDPSSADYRTIFRVLNERNISWKVYASEIDFPGASMFNSFRATDKGGHVVPLSEFVADAAAGRLPEVSWIDPQLLFGNAQQSSEHPPADMQVGQRFVYTQVQALLKSPNWPTSAMFITYDEHGGLYDHVPPPPACPPDDTPPKETGFGGFDRYGFRVPVFVVSPFAKPHFVSHVVHSHSSILRFIEARFDLPALTKRDANSDAMLDMFDFEGAPSLLPPPLTEPPVDPAKLEACLARYGQ
jgi:phospholipase C